MKLTKAGWSAALLLLLLSGCRITDDMGTGEKLALGTLYLLGIVALTALLVALYAWAAFRSG